MNFEGTAFKTKAKYRVSYNRKCFPWYMKRNRADAKEWSTYSKPKYERFKFRNYCGCPQVQRDSSVISFTTFKKFDKKNDRSTLLIFLAWDHIKNDVPTHDFSVKKWHTRNRVGLIFGLIKNIWRVFTIYVTDLTPSKIREAGKYVSTNWRKMICLNNLF